MGAVRGASSSPGTRSSTRAWQRRGLRAKRLCADIPGSVASSFQKPARDEEEASCGRQGGSSRVLCPPGLRRGVACHQTVASGTRSVRKIQAPQGENILLHRDCRTTAEDGNHSNSRHRPSPSSETVPAASPQALNPKAELRNFRGSAGRGLRLPAEQTWRRPEALRRMPVTADAGAQGRSFVITTVVSRGTVASECCCQVQEMRCQPP